jgi:hypothetical protein
MVKSSARYEIRNIDPHDLIPWERNPRKHNMPALRASIERFGFRNVIVVNGRTNTIEAGHGRAQAAIDLGIQEVPVLFVDDDDATAAAYAIADNRQTEISGWDDEALLKLLLELQALDQNASIGVGYTDEDIADLVRKVEGINISGLDIINEWQGMPEFKQDDLTAWKSLIVNFDSAESMQQFSELLGQPLTQRTRSIWYPQAEISHLVRQRYVTETFESTAYE